MNDHGDQMSCKSHLFIYTDLNSNILTVFIAFYEAFSTHQFPFLHALHDHEQDLLRLAFTIIESLLNGHQKLVSDVIANQTERRRLNMNSQF